MEELFGPGIIGANWKVTPDLKTRRCKFTMKKNVDPTIDNGNTISAKKRIQIKKINIKYEI